VRMLTEIRSQLANRSTRGDGKARKAPARKHRGPLSKHQSWSTMRGSEGIRQADQRHDRQPRGRHFWKRTRARLAVLKRQPRPQPASRSATSTKARRFLPRRLGRRTLTRSFSLATRNATYRVRAGQPRVMKLSAPRAYLAVRTPSRHLQPPSHAIERKEG